MRTYLSFGDFIELYYKARQRGWGFIASKLHLNGLARTQSAFDIVDIPAANYWMIDRVRARWAEKISGDPAMAYEDYVVHKYFAQSSGLKMLSLGCGVGSHEPPFAKYPAFEQITGIDLAPQLVEAANINAQKKGLKNLQYICADLNNFEYPNNTYDLILFHSSLHHFNDLDKLLGKTLKEALKPGGILLIHEYVGPDRLQWTSEQLKTSNALLATLPHSKRTRFKTQSVKRRDYRPGWLRMCISDPSEAVESSRILPVIHHHYNTLEEKALGGNILQLLLKDIAHHFTATDADTNQWIDRFFAAEDHFLENHPSDLVFGLYQKKSRSVTK